MAESDGPVRWCSTMTKWLALLLMFPLVASAGASRIFDGTVPDFMEASGAAPVTATPFSMSCWANRDDGLGGTLLWVGDTDVTNQMQYIFASTTNHRAHSRNVSFDDALTSAAAAVDEWHLTTGMWVATDDRRVQADAAIVIAQGTNITDLDPQNEDLLGIGMSRDSTPSSGFDGALSHCGLWSDQLTDPEIDDLAAGLWTSWVATDTLAGFWPILGDSTEIDLSSNKNDMTVTGAGVDTRGPPVFFPIGGM